RFASQESARLGNSAGTSVSSAQNLVCRSGTRSYGASEAAPAGSGECSMAGSAGSGGSELVCAGPGASANALYFAQTGGVGGSSAGSAYPGMGGSGESVGRRLFDTGDS